MRKALLLAAQGVPRLLGKVPVRDATCVEEDLSIVSKPPEFHQRQVDQLPIHFEQLHTPMESCLV